jgi:hypothetical protein
VGKFLSTDIIFEAPFEPEKKREKAHYLGIENGYTAGCFLGLE